VMIWPALRVELMASLLMYLVEQGVGYRLGLRLLREKERKRYVMNEGKDQTKESVV